MSITLETIFKSTLGKIVSGAAVLVSAGWLVRGQFNDMMNEISALRHGQIALETKVENVDKKLDNQFVTWPIARLYASETRRANAGLPLYLPDVDEYQKANRTN